jgi:membrane protein implicated in regulation of membrane protease activity
MPGWILWVIAAGAFAIARVLTKKVFFAPFVLGALLAAIVDLAGAGALVDWLMFLVVAVALSFARRAHRQSRARARQQLYSGAAALIGKEAIVLETIANEEGVGCIGVGGEVWTARTVDSGQVIEQGARVEVIGSRGATALVTE